MIEEMKELISKIWDKTIGIEGVDTGYPKFVEELSTLIDTRGNEIREEAVMEFGDMQLNRYLESVVDK